ncbi:hypothetical protein Tco_1475856 [Tanacetum coccineum]
MAQQVIPAAQLVPKYHTIGRCNNYVVLQSIPCSPECKIIGQILIDHQLSYALTATADVPSVYLQQFWRTVSKVPGPEETIKFMMNTQQFVYTVDMFQDILHFLVETLEKPFVAPVNIETIKTFMNRVFNRCLTTRTSGHDQTMINILQLFHAVINRTNVDYAALLWWDFMSNVKKKKESIQYPRFIKLIIADLMNKFTEIPKRIKEDYHSIKDDIPLVSVYTTRDVRVRGMLIPDVFLTEEILLRGKKRKQGVGESSSPTIKKKKQSTPSIPPLSDDRERDEIVKVTLLCLTLHKTALAAEAQENIAKVQEKLAKEEIDKMVEELGSHKENPENVDDDVAKIKKDKDDEEIEKDKDDEKIEKKKKDEEIEKEVTDDEIEKDNIDEAIVKEKQADTVEKTIKVVKDKDIVVDVTGIFEEFTAIVSPTTATTSKDSSTTKRKKQSISFNKIQETLDHCNKVVPNVTFAKTKEMITQEMSRLFNIAVNKDREVDPINAKEMIAKEFATHGTKMIEDLFRKHMQNTTLNLYPTTSSSTARNSSTDLQHQLYLNMKSNPQDQAADSELWKILKAKFDKP